MLGVSTLTADLVFAGSAAIDLKPNRARPERVIVIMVFTAQRLITQVD